MALLWLHTHTHVYVVKEYYNHTQPLPLTPSYWAGWVAVLTKSRLNGHLRWIIVCEWKLGQIISMLLAQGWVRPLSPSLHARTHTHTHAHTHTHTHTHAYTPCAHTQLLFYHLYFHFTLICWLFAFYNKSFSVLSVCLFCSLFLFLFYYFCFLPSLNPFFSQQLWPLSCRPFTSLRLPSPVPAVNSRASWKHKHAQAWDEQLSHDRPLLTTATTTTTTSLSAPLHTRGLCASGCFSSDLLSEVYLHHRCNSCVCLCLSSCQSALCEC